MLNYVMIVYFLLRFIRLYQYLRKGFNQCCRFSPTCSEYAYITLEKEGLRGTWKIIKRIWSCRR